MPFSRKLFRYIWTVSGPSVTPRPILSPIIATGGALHASMANTAIVTSTFSRWNHHDGQRLGAALAFYTMLSAAPMLLFLLLAVSALYGPDAGERGVVDYVRALLGDPAASLTQTF